MNKYLLYTVLIIGLSWFSCTDDKTIFDDIGQKVPVSLTVSFTGDIQSRDVSDKDEELDYTTDPQSAMSSDDVYVLIVSHSDDSKLMGLVQDLKLEPVYNNYNEKRLLGNIPDDVVGQDIRLVVLANLNQNQINLGNASSVKDFLTSKIGDKVSEIYQSLIYTYNYDDAPWEIIREGKVVRRIPMWGETKNFTLPADGLTLECLLYRAIAKVNIWINGKEGINSFKINSITVNHANKGGYVVSSQTVSDDIKIQYTKPDVPSTVTFFSETEKITYDNLTEEQATKAFSDVIFLPEHVNTGEGSTPVSLTVNYTFNGDVLEKNIEFKDEQGKPFDVVRNHSYIFNITKTHQDFIFKVIVEPWGDVYMRGAPDQYTLTVDKSVITLKDYVDYKNSDNPDHHYIVYDLDVWTDYAYGWKIETNENGKIIGTNGEVIDWLDIVNTSGNTNETVTVKLNANKINTGLAKTAKFYVKAGNIQKEITVIMPQPETANCYVVGDGEYEIIVTIKGNGVDGTRPEGMDIVDGDESTGPTEDSTLEPSTLGIIWETKEGLITLWDYEKKTYVGGGTKVPYNPQTGTLGFSVKSNYTGAYIAGAPGGNALIGAFGGDGKLIWSWHIWACPEMYDSETHQIIENAFLQNWTYTGYQVMDRNLGALTNMPIDLSDVEGKNLNGVSTNQYGVAAMGLQYQWGRKDPFIGPAYSNDKFDDKNPDGLLPVVHYYEKWGVNGAGEDVANNVDKTAFSASEAINYTINHPTQLIYWDDGEPTALVSYSKNNENQGQYLWGTNGGLSHTNRDLGTKTIYDPCPVGYRVPPVDAFYFEHPDKSNVNKNSFDHNFRYNIVFIPHYAKHFLMSYGSKVTNQTGEEAAKTAYNNLLADLAKYDNQYKKGEYQWGNHPYWLNTKVRNPSSSWWASDYYYICYEGPHVDNAYYYGFYLNRANITEPLLTANTYNGIDHNQHVINKKTEEESTISYYYKPSDGQELTWLPLTGAYDPTIGISFKDDNDKTIEIERGSSITVNSFLWTNSSVVVKGKRLPGALALHGAEVSTQFYGASDQSKRWGADANGRHIHGMMDEQDAVQIQRHFTSGVRCIKDTKKVDWQTSNSLTEKISIKKGQSGSIEIKAVNGSWRLVDPGAPWIQITPEKGDATGAQEASITVKVSADVNAGSTTNIGFLIEGETTPRYCTVTVN